MKFIINFRSKIQLDHPVGLCCIYVVFKICLSFFKIASLKDHIGHFIFLCKNLLDHPVHKLKLAAMCKKDIIHGHVDKMSQLLSSFSQGMVLAKVRHPHLRHDRLRRVPHPPRRAAHDIDEDAVGDWPHAQEACRENGRRRRRRDGLFLFLVGYRVRKLHSLCWFVLPLEIQGGPCAMGIDYMGWN